MFFFCGGGGTIVQQKVIKKNVVQQTVKNKKFVHKTGRKMGLYGEKICLFLGLRGKKVCFWLATKKKVCTGKKTHSPPHTHTRIIWSAAYVERFRSRNTSRCCLCFSRCSLCQGQHCRFCVTFEFGILPSRKYWGRDLA